MPRIRLNLDGYWDFFTDPQKQFDHGTLLAADNPRRIRVPGPWQAQFDDLRDYTGVGWYRLRFEVSPAFVRSPMPNPTYVLHFGAVDYFAEAWLNGNYLGTHEGGYLPFEFDLTAALNLQGGNELVVRVLDPGAESELQGEMDAVFAEIPHGKQSWYGPISGIWQSVYLEKRNATCISQIHITPNVADESAEIELQFNHPTQTALDVELSLNDPLGNVRSFRFEVEAHQTGFNTTLSIPSPLLWDTRNPQMYTLDARLSDEIPLLFDQLSSAFGMRSIATTTDGHLMLNGRVLYLRGALDQDYYPDLIYTPFSDAELERQFAQAKHMGLNCLRTHIKITDPRYYDAADRMGILIWTELPNWQNLTPQVRRRVKETLSGMIARDWNHPSIIIWTLVNEGWGVDLASNAEHRQWLADTYDYVKGLDPHRLLVGNSACYTNFHVVTDIQDFHNYYSIPDHYREWHDWVENFASRPAWVYAHVYEGISAWREYLRDPWNREPRAFAPEVRRTGSEPMVISEFGNWGLPDINKLRACYENQDPWWFETGMEWGDGAVYPHGVEKRFHLWRLDKVFANLSQLAAASQWMQYKALKYQIEQIRQHPSIVGYFITEFTDVHWECNGLLDMCRNPKVFYDALVGINGPDSLIAVWERVSFWEGEQVSMELLFSHFSDLDLKDGRVEWWLEGFPVRGEFSAVQPEMAGITVVGDMMFQVPHLEASACVKLNYRLCDAQGHEVTCNSQELYLFPQHLKRAVPFKVAATPEWREPLQRLGYQVTEDLESAEVLITGTVTDELRNRIQQGGRVLWLAETDDAQQTTLGALETAPRKGRRWQGDWASNFNWIRHDLLFQDIPTHGIVDFAFADLTPEHVILGFPPAEFAVDVFAGLFVGWIHDTTALIGKRRLGNGLILASTFRLRNCISATNQHPVATIMLHDMITHLANAPALATGSAGAKMTSTA